MDKAPQVSLYSTAHFFLEGLNEIGIDYLFCNLGTDHAPLIEEMAHWRNKGRKLPVAMLCPHENTAMRMAAGYAMVTGRGQAVLVHVDVPWIASDTRENSQTWRGKPGTDHVFIGGAAGRNVGLSSSVVGQACLCSHDGPARPRSAAENTGCPKQDCRWW